jgi:NAD(P)-dependent dehydrogenase (short-subunit alcohol dehydrogenase family)
MDRSEGKTALVTGARTGVGYELAKKLLAEGWQVAALNRSDMAAGDPLIDAALKDGRLRVYKGDLADFKSLKAAIAAIKTGETKIDVFFNNAGVGTDGIFFSPQRREMHFEVNSVAPYILLQELKALVAQGDDKIVINTSSNSLLFLKAFDPALLERPTVFKKLFGPYAASKMALSLWTQEIAGAMSAEGIDIRSACPGPNKTPMTEQPGMPWWLKPFVAFVFPLPTKGAGLLYKAAFGKHRGTGGVFLNKNEATPLKFAAQGPRVFQLVDGIYRREFLAT